MAELRYERMRVERTARYGILGEPGSEVREVWFVLHGYAQTAEEVLEPFAALATPRRRFVAPEGLSRFYRKGTHGEVGASWMTKVERAREIEEQRAWLDALHARILGEEASDEVAVHVLGFSQGAAAACRWIARGAVRPARVVLWAGTVPPDLTSDAFAARLPEGGFTLVLGDRDAFLPPERVEQELARLEGASLPFTLVRYAGGHRLDAALLADVLG